MTITDIHGKLIQFLPNELDAANGDTFEIVWVDQKEDHNDLDPVYGTIGVISETVQNDREWGMWGRLNGVTENTQDTIAFSSGTDVYQVVNRDINTVNSVKATVNGSTQTLTEGTDYDVFSTEEYTTDDAIKFLDGGTKPDDGTDFTVDYDHNLYQREFKSYTQSLIRFVIHTREYESGENTGKENASKRHKKVRLAYQLGKSLEQFLTKNRGTSIDNNNLIRVKELANHGVFDVQEGESLTTNLMDVQFTYENIGKTGPVEAIGNVEAQTKPRLFDGDTYDSDEYDDATYE